MTLLLQNLQIAMNEGKGTYFGFDTKGVCNFPMNFPSVFFMKAEKKDRSEVSKKELAS